MVQMVQHHHTACVTGLWVRSVLVSRINVVLTTKKVTRKAKRWWKISIIWLFWAIGGDLWRQNYFHINFYWHPWLGTIFSTFGGLLCKRRTKWGPFQQFGPHEDQVLNWGPFRNHCLSPHPRLPPRFSHGTVAGTVSDPCGEASQHFPLNDCGGCVHCSATCCFIEFVWLGTLL